MSRIIITGLHENLPANVTIYLVAYDAETIASDCIYVEVTMDDVYLGKLIGRTIGVTTIWNVWHAVGGHSIAQEYRTALDWLLVHESNWRLDNAD